MKSMMETTGRALMERPPCGKMETLQMSRLPEKGFAMNRRSVFPGLTILYERLSRDDELAGDSSSIVNQKKMLEEYAAKNGFTNILHITDDGYTGGNFERPGWKKLIEEVERGNVATIIVKDMTRVGRDYLQVGFYTEVLFREKGVRFIAISNSIDSEDRDSGEFAPFLNIMSEWYLRDSSRKVKAAMKAKGSSGQRLTFAPIYGYVLDPNDKGKWIIDPEAAAIIRRIFQLTIDGKGPGEIARMLHDDKVERPSYYLAAREIVKYTQYDNSNPYAWSGNSIAHMLKKPEYLGHTVNFRSYKDSYKDKKAKVAQQEDWVVFENTHPAIIDPGTFETAQRCRKTVRRTDFMGEANPLTGLLFCADCGAKLYNHRKLQPTAYTNEKGYACTRGPLNFYACSTYTLTSRKFDRKCTRHNIRTAVLRELVLDAIRSASSFVKSNEAEFVRQVREASAIQQTETAKAHTKRIAKEEKRIAELNGSVRRLYEDNVNGKLTDKRFELLSGDYEREQMELEQSVIRLQAELDGFREDTARADKFIEIVKKHTDFTELTSAMIHEYIDKIVVHEADKSSGERVQQVDIHLNFIGKFDIPSSEPTPEEIAAEEKAREKRARHREAQLRYTAKQKTAATESQQITA